MKPLIVSLLVFSLFLYWIIGDSTGVLSEGARIGKEVYSKNEEATSTGGLMAATSSEISVDIPSVPLVTHISTPKEVKAVYMSSWVAGTPSVRSRIISLIDDTELNAVVVDVKDNTGAVSWDGRIRDLDILIKELHAKNIYVIARIAAFQDPEYVKLHPELAVKNTKTGSVWKDHKGVPWVDPGSRAMWEYLVEIGKEAYARGFDEINYDYIRFPTDGDLKTMSFPISKERGISEKRDVIREFFRFLSDEFSSPHIPISGDVFGIITTNSVETDTLGQDLGDAFVYFDFVAPMVYPSHFYAGTAGYQNPAAHPKEIILYSMEGALTIAQSLASSTRNASGTPIVASSTFIAKLRPWYQDFDMGATYTKEMVRAQITAGEELSIRSWMLWDPANRYTKEALLPKGSQ